MDEVIAGALRIDWQRLGVRTLCDPCLGRLLGKIGHGYTNAARGQAIRAACRIPEGPCWLCEGLTSEFDNLARLVTTKVEPWEFDTFLIGSRIEPEMAAREESLWAELAATAPEPLKSEVNREVGKRVADLVSKEPDRDHPDIVAIVDPAFDHVDLEINPLFLRGRYRKLVGGIPQTRWPCRRCRGKGCARCDGTGKMYATSVEEVVADVVMAETGGTGHALHGMGREDVDARMLGRGRPFVVEIREPRRRTFDVRAAVERVNRTGSVEIDTLAPATRADVLAVKGDRAAKSYRIRFRATPPVDGAKIKEGLATLAAQPIAQRTPSRVMHRRADRTRHRRLLDADLLKVDQEYVEVRLTAETGMYVKELVHGDRGRTSPSLADCLGIECEILELDVLDVHDGG